MTKYKLTEQVLKEAANFMAKAAQLTLQAKHTRTAIRGKWKKVGESWQPDGAPMKQKFRANYVSSGNLVRSIQPIAEGLQFGIEFDSYGQRIIDGREPFGKNKGGKGIPPSTLNEWMKMKRLRPKDPSNGQFIKNTAANRKSMSYLMNRKIKWFGIEPFDFVKMPRKYTMDKYRVKIKEAMKQDIANKQKPQNKT
jgi:hypothetical protein